MKLKNNFCSIVKMISSEVKIRAKTLLSKFIKGKDLDLLETELLSKSTDETEYLDTVYQTSFDLKASKLSIVDIISLLRNHKTKWKSPFFQKMIYDENEQDTFIENPFEVHEGALECSRCNSKRVFSFQKQTRGADEPATTFAQCVQCNNKWTYSG